MKRAIDIAGALVALVLLAPLFALVAIAIKLDSPGPVFFRQDRVGRGMRRFRVLKFRTMRHQSTPPTALITKDGDERITRVGHLLRRMKVDEFPQLVNVLIGDMSIVGPRPEVPKYVEQFARDFEAILSVRPGLTDPASFKYRQEGTILARAVDPEREYVERILPDKIRLAKRYLAEASLSLDLVLILKTFLEAVGMEAAPIGRGVLKYRRPIIITIHLALVVVSYYAAWNLRFDGNVPAREVRLFLMFLPWLLGIRAVLFSIFRLYQGLWRYTSVSDVTNVIAAVSLGSILFVFVVRVLYGELAHPRSVFFIDAMLLIGLTVGVRLARRIYHELATGGPGARVIVFGAGDTGESIVRELKKNNEYRVVALADDDVEKHGRRIHGVQVLGGRSELRRMIAELKPTEILIAMDTNDSTVTRDIVRIVEYFDLRLTTVPSLSGTLHRRIDLADVRSLRPEDLLSRPALNLDLRPLSRMLQARRVMVTGAGGSIGSELCRQIVRLRPASLVMFERYENSLHAIRLELEDLKLSCPVHPVIGDVADVACVGAVLKQYEPEIIFHAAAHKHVPLMEENPCEAIKNNVRGTRLLAEAAELHGVDRFILVSTDKAVNPSSVMGASKRLAELAVQMQAVGSGTSFAIVRFGNVLGSNGSVVPRFLEQIRKGGPVTITHPEMRRFFMLIPEAVQLVLHAAAQADSGATYVLEMGEQVKVLDMARDLIRLAGLVPDEDIPIEFVGLRPGEKLYEELAGLNEDVGPSKVEKILRVTSRNLPSLDLLTSLEAIEEEAAKGNVEAVMAGLKSLIPEYSSPEMAGAATARPADTSASVHPAPLATFSSDILHCPHCKDGRIRRSHARSIAERVKRGLTEERLFRCEQCGWRGWMVPLVFAGFRPVAEVPPPDLSRLDEVVASNPGPPRPSFSPRNLH
jgi:FlaA1/EpsC-like NDP-sugar epimerase/lipopolysaccharide/colanic/teichoic acid biosynthesis glycosyltransferase